MHKQNSINLLLLFLILTVIGKNNLYSQSFSGELTYRFNTDDYRQMEILESYGIDILEEFQNTTENFLINKDTLFSIKYSFDSISLKSGMQQYGDTAHLYDDKSFSVTDFDRLHKNGINYIFIEKTNEIDTILGELCFKYIYLKSNTFTKDEIIVYAWIPNNFVFPDTYSYGKFFKLFFFEHGLAFRKEVLYKGSIRTWTLIDIKESNK